MNAIVRNINFSELLPLEMQKSWAPVYGQGGHIDRAQIAAWVTEYRLRS